MHDGDAVLVACAGRHVCGQPGHELVHLFDGLRDRGGVLLAPAADLALEVVAGLAVAGQAALGEFDAVQRGDDAVRFVVDGRALGRCHAGQGLVPQHAALHEFHHVEGSADHGLVLAQCVHARHGHVGALQAAHHGEFALDGVGRGQQLGHGAGLGAHHIALAGCDELVGGVGLPALEHLDAQGALEALEVLFQPGTEGRGVERVLPGHGTGADEMVEIAHG